MLRGSVLAPLLVALLLCSAAPARAAGLDGLMIGLNGLLTFPADPVVDTVVPPEDFEDFPGKEFFRYPFGFVHGALLGTYRALSGVADIAFTPLWIVPTLSPEPRYDVLPFYDFEAEEESEPASE